MASITNREPMSKLTDKELWEQAEKRFDYHQETPLHSYAGLYGGGFDMADIKQNFMEILAKNEYLGLAELFKERIESGHVNGNLPYLKYSPPYGHCGCLFAWAQYADGVANDEASVMRASNHPTRLLGKYRTGPLTDAEYTHYEIVLMCVRPGDTAYNHPFLMLTHRWINEYLGSRVGATEV